MEQQTVRWRRFMRKPFATFCSLNKEVNVGVLSLAMLASFDSKAATNEGVAVMGVPAESQETAVTQLDSVNVSASRVPLTNSETARMVTVLNSRDIKGAAVHTVNDLLKYAVGADVRQRGEMGVQTDISLRGGTFDQITILLNGVNINSPQTGHLSADFAVTTDDIDHIEVLEGPAARLFGTSAFSGAINIVTKRDTQSNVQAHVYGGQYGLAGGTARLNIASKKVQQQISGGYDRCDGAVDNSDFKQGKAFYQGHYDGAQATADWMLGYSNQGYGANTFYSAAYPNQYEETERYLASVKAETKGKLHIAPTLYWNRSYDHFELIKDTHTGENFHRNDVYGINLNSWWKWFLGKTSIGAEMRNEGILSTNLGKVMTNDSVKVHGEDGIYYKKKDNRTNISYYLEHDVLLRDWTISLGLMANTNSALDEDIHFYPGIDVSYRPTQKWKLTASWNKALRMPTFTDLYYKSPTNEGNVGLEPEEVESFNLSARYRTTGLELVGAAYYSHGTNMIDWVMYTADDIYHSANFKLDNMGGEITAALYLRELIGENFAVNKISASYAYIYQERDDNVTIYKSNYALEYLRNKVVLSADGRIWKNLNLSLFYRWKDRMGSYLEYENHKSTGKKVDYKPYGTVDAKLSWDAPHYTIYAEANNLFDENYYDLGNVEQPGIWVKAGVKINFDLFK